MNPLCKLLITVVFVAMFGVTLPSSVRGTDYSHQNSLADTDHAGDLGQTNGVEKFVVRRAGRDRYFDVYVRGKRVFTVKERRFEGDFGPPGSYIEDYIHDFYLSPDHRYLFTEQKVMHCFDTVTLYGPVGGGHYGAILTKRLQFDDAALRAFGKVMHIPEDKYAGGTDVTHFVHWTPGGLNFTMATATFYCGSGPQATDDIEYDWSGHYDLKTRRFTKIRVLRVYSHADWMKERAERGN